MAHCARCDKDVWPIQELVQGRGCIDACPTCLTPMAPAPPASVATPAAAPVPGDVLAVVRARAVCLRNELTVLEAKRTELAMLERMLIAADLEDETPSQSVGAHQ